MKKAIALLMLEIVIILMIPILINSYLFSAPSLRVKPILFVLRISFQRSSFSISNASELIKRIVYFAIMTLAFAIQFVLIFQGIRKSLKNAMANKNTHSHGTQRFATSSEVVKNGMADKEPNGIILGQSNDAWGIKLPANNKKMFKIIKKGKHIISDKTQYHAIIFGATGSGKGVGIINPTLLFNTDSVVVLDPKGESYTITAGWRSSFSNVYYFNPKDTQGRSCHINILDFVPRDKTAVSEIANLVMTIHPNKSQDEYWDSTPRMMIGMICGHVILNGKQKSIPEAYNMLFNSGLKESDKYLKILKENGVQEENEGGSLRWIPKLDEDNPLYSLQQDVLAKANQFYSLSSGNDSTQISTHNQAVMSDLSVFASDGDYLSSSDFTLDDICDGEKPVSLYLCPTVKDLDVLMPIYKIISSMIFKHLLTEQQKHKHKLLLILDEFYQFGKFELVTKMLPFVRSFGIRIMIFVQSISQLDEIYGHDSCKAIIDNCQLKVFLRASSNETLKYIEEMLGSKTYLKKSASFSNNRKTGVGVDSSNESTSEVGKKLLTYSELGNLASYKELIFTPDLFPIKAKKIQFFADPRMNDRINLEVEPSSIMPSISRILEEIQSASLALTEEEIRNIHKYTLELSPELAIEERKEEKQSFMATIDNITENIISNAKSEENSKPENEDSNIDITIEEDHDGNNYNEFY